MSRHPGNSSYERRSRFNQALGNVVANHVALHPPPRNSVEHIINRPPSIYRFTLAVHHVIALVRKLEHIGNQSDFASGLIRKRRSTSGD